MYTLDSFAIGVGSANIAMCNALLDAVFVRLPVCWLLAFTVQMGFTGIYIGQAVSPVLPAIVGLLYFMSKKWKSKKLLDHELTVRLISIKHHNPFWWYILQEKSVPR